LVRCRSGVLLAEGERQHKHGESGGSQNDRFSGQVHIEISWFCVAEVASKLHNWKIRGEERVLHRGRERNDK
jgi:hypothetical protein